MAQPYASTTMAWRASPGTRKLTAEEMLHRMAIAPPHIGFSASPLLSLPTTVFVQILSHLPPESVAALTLACRALYASTLRQVPRDVQEPWIRLYATPGESSNSSGIIPLSEFARDDTIKLHYSMEVHQTLEARIVNGELLLSGCYRFRGWEYPNAIGPFCAAGKYGSGVTEELERRRWRICPHQRVCAGLRIAKSDHGQAGSHLETLEKSLLKNLPRMGVVGKQKWHLGWSCCEFCYTDYAVMLSNIDPLNLREGTQLGIWFYRNLGSFRAPDDSKWRAAADVFDSRVHTGFGKSTKKLRDADGLCDVFLSYDEALQAEKRISKKKAEEATALRGTAIASSKRDLENKREKEIDQEASGANMPPNRARNRFGSVLRYVEKKLRT
ncbi:uncharacterized protein LTHEOB_1278 [Lasiodiplodia theobromae]|nr:uncharacterized protein LTHEOB_1278 [Lasiodiplodia theobromae]KAF4538924.1 hypothetical protein LTHEOB_1278 [Lasiodiplodia theobromae]